MGKNQHVLLSRKGRGDVTAEGASKATGNVPTQHEAIEVTQEVAQNQGSELIIHGGETWA